MPTSHRPQIREIGYDEESLRELVTELAERPHNDRERKLIYEYPTVYVVHDEHDDEYDVYVGETSDISRRTIQHLRQDPRLREDWLSFLKSEASHIFVIGHPLFNKSLTLDVEDKLRLYFTGVDAVRTVQNRRPNAQRNYYTQEHFDQIFSDIWRSLGRRNKRLFPSERIIQDSALFKASPFHKLTDEQLHARDEVHAAITEALRNPTLGDEEEGKLIVVEGAAGTGKTVLISSLFYELFQGETEDADPFSFQDLDAYLVVNHDQQLTVYDQVAKKLGLGRSRDSRVLKPTKFINGRQPGDRADVVLVDEAHLLWTQGKQSYRGKNQLHDLLQRAKVVVAVMDPKQGLATNQYWEPEQRAWLSEQETIQLGQQMRIASEPQTWQWLRTVIDEGRVTPIPGDEKYELRVFDSPGAMHDAIRRRNRDQEMGLSRMLATYDWDFVRGRPSPTGEKWMVRVDLFTAPWNLQIEYSKEDARRNQGLSWAEQEATIEEIGSTFTIQGFDLNYAGVILGESIRYRDGRIVFDSSASSYKQAIQKRGLENGLKQDVSEELLRNQLNVLLTRGVHGLYLFAVDPELQEALMTAQADRTLV